MATVKIFGNLRSYTSASVLDVQGKTLHCLLQNLCADNNALREAIFDGERLHPFVRVMVNGHDNELGQGLDTPIVMTDQIAIFPPIAGG